MQPLAGKVAVVTGAGRGLGRGVVTALARAGAAVALVDITDDELHDAAASISAEGAWVLAVHADVADPASVAAMIATVHGGLGRVDILVNAAAILEMRTFAESDYADWQRTLAINLSGPWLCAKAVLPDMQAAGRGSIVNVSSRAGIEGHARETAYCAAKFGVEGLSYSLALELAAENIAVNLVTPGIHIKPTSMTMAQFYALSPAEQVQWADPLSTGDGFIYLALQNGRGITGQRFNVWELAERVRREALLMSAVP